MEAALNVPLAIATLQKRRELGQLRWTGPLLMLVARLILFALFQALIAGVFALQGTPRPWEASIAWWPISATLTNLVCLFLLDRWLRLEGLRLRDLYRFDRSYFVQDLLVVLGITLLSAPLVLVPSYGLGTLLFGDANATAAMMFKPLPLWAGWIALLLFPLSIAFAELPTYFAYVTPRIAVLSGKSWLGVLLPVLMLSFQHSTLPLILDWRFLVWRLWMFMGFALLLGLCLNWRPRLLPYLMVVHGLLDLATAWMVFSLAK